MRVSTITACMCVRCLHVTYIHAYMQMLPRIRAPLLLLSCFSRFAFYIKLQLHASTAAGSLEHTYGDGSCYKEEEGPLYSAGTDSTCTTPSHASSSSCINSWLAMPSVSPPSWSSSSWSSSPSSCAATGGRVPADTWCRVVLHAALRCVLVVGVEWLAGHVTWRMAEKAVLQQAASSQLRREAKHVKAAAADGQSRPTSKQLDERATHVVEES